MIEVENTDVNIVRNLIPMRNHMLASAYGLKAISDWLFLILRNEALHIRRLDTYQTDIISLIQI